MGAQSVHRILLQLIEVVKKTERTVLFYPTYANLIFLFREKTMKLTQFITAFTLLISIVGSSHSEESTLVFSPEVKTLIAQSLKTEDSGNYAGAIKIHQKILKLQPKNIYSINTIAGLYGKLGAFSEEIVWAKKAIDVDSNYELAYLNYGNGLFGLGKVNEAKNAFKQALKINPKSADANYSLGVLSDSQDNFDSAVQFYIKATEFNPKFESAFFNLGVDYVNLKKYDEALIAFNKALKINPNDSDAKMMISEIEKNRAN